MTVFDTAIDSLFDDDNLAVAGTYTPRSGLAVSVRVMLSDIEEPTDVFSAGKVVNKIKADIRTSELSRCEADDSLVIGSDVYTVANPQRKDISKLIWVMELID